MIFAYLRLRVVAGIAFDAAMNFIPREPQEPFYMRSLLRVEGV